MNALLRCLVLYSLCSLTFAGDMYEIEKRRLFSPTTAERASQDRGQVYIYDGLRDVDIGRAIDEHFGRVEHMMFIRVKITDDRGKPAKDPSTGAAVINDDDC